MKQPAPGQLSTMQPIKGPQGFIPAMLKLENKSILIVGGETDAAHLLQHLLQLTHQCHIRLVAQAFCSSVQSTATTFSISLVQREWKPEDLEQTDIVFVTETRPGLIHKVLNAAKQTGSLLYIADHPHFSDFYPDAFSKNVSPPLQAHPFLTYNSLLELKNIYSVSDITNNALGSSSGNGSLLPQTGIEARPETYWKKIASRFLFAFFFMIAGHILLSFIPLRDLYISVSHLPDYFDERFLWMIAAGFFAQLVDGALGMGYGVTCTTILLSLGINLPAISASIHTAEMFSSGVSGYSHYKFGNVNKKLFKTLLIPGVLGAIAGACLLSAFGEKYAAIIRPLLAAYTLVLGIRILRTAFAKRKKATKVKRAGWLAGAGGFLDSFGGGGWGPLVTSTLIAKGRTPKYVIGTVSITEFFVTLASAVTFFSLIGISHWQVLLGLIVGGMLGAPLAARLAGKLPLKTMFIGVGVMVIIWSLRILLKSLW